MKKTGIRFEGSKKQTSLNKRFREEVILTHWVTLSWKWYDSSRSQQNNKKEIIGLSPTRHNETLN